MLKYDLLIDIDASDHSEILHANKCTIEICKRLKQYDIEFEIVFSGCGFHIVIPYKHFETKKFSFDPDSDNSIYSAYSLIAKKLSSKYSEMVDYNLNDSRRLCKIPYSLAIYENNIYMCCPLSFYTLQNFKLEDYKPDKAIKWLDDKHRMRI